ncbi:B12-binding domain/radical SAM domain-containing protein [Patescibacteria group bacterium]|nr:B12-binding domain/radical SAM domain-containing protein [Patescibacteria group bacterium]
MAIRVIAVAAPELPEGKIGTGVLSSDDPASLFNACRYAAFLAENDIGFWGESNWASPRKERRETFLLMHSLKENLPIFEKLLEKIQPNLLLIGAMSLCLPGAVACAKKAKKMFGDEICVVLGGRHANETIYPTQEGTIKHHFGSPLRLMAEERIDRVFDLVVSGEGEYIIASIGEIVGGLDQRKISPAEISNHLQEISQTSGKWIVGWVDDIKEIHVVEGRSSQFDRNYLPSPVEMFGVSSTFDVFPGSLTAHVFSDSSSGCVYDCIFCSERRSVTGPLIQLDTAADRLFRQLKSTTNVIQQDSPSFKASAFVEDSTILAGSNNALNRLARLLTEEKLDLRFGGQLTIDQILSKVEIIKNLKFVGFDYLFVGMETLEPKSVGGMSKDTKFSEDSWLRRTEKVLEILNSLEIQCGLSLLFGLGENHDSRIRLLFQIKKWRENYGIPNPIGLNWAVQHPLRGNDGGTGYKYIEWGIPSGPWIEMFRDFGEASVLYPLANQKPPILKEVQEIADFYHELPEIKKRATINQKKGEVL